MTPLLTLTLTLIARLLAALALLGGAGLPPAGVVPLPFVAVLTALLPAGCWSDASTPRWRRCWAPAG